MAGDWIKWSKGLAARREVVLLASLLQRDRYEIAGRLMCLWEWLDDNVADTEIDELSLDASLFVGDTPFAFLDALLGLPGFADALASPGVCWLSVRSGGRLTFPHFGRHNGTTAKTRALESRKKQRQRSMGKIATEKLSRDERDNIGTREEKTVQNRTEQNRAAVVKPKTESEIDPLPLGKINPASVFRALTPKHLASARSMVEWFRRQLSATAPVLEATREDQLFAMCCSMRATDPGIEKPVGKFVNLVQGRRWSEVERYRQAAEAAIADVEASMSRELIVAAG